MPDTTTANYALTKIGVGESKDTWGGKVNANMDAIDAAIKAVADGIVAAQLLAKLLTVDGAGSGLDADLLDGQSSAYYAPASAVTAAALLAQMLTVDGAGSGLDADKLDGVEGAGYSLTGHNHDGTYVKRAGDTVTGDIVRNTAGAHFYHTNSLMLSGRVFLTPSTDPDPTSLPGDIWLTY